MKNEAVVLNYEFKGFFVMSLKVFLFCFGKAIICLSPSDGSGLLHPLTVKVYSSSFTPSAINRWHADLSISWGSWATGKGEPPHPRHPQKGLSWSSTNEKV